MIFVMSTSTATLLPCQRTSLMLTSRHFCSIICSTAELWTDIPSDIPIDLFPLYLERSKAREISIGIRLGTNGESPSTATYKLASVGSRLANLTIVGSPKEVTGLLLHAGPLSPALRTLALFNDNGAGEAVKDSSHALPQSLLRGTSVLRKLEMNHGFHLRHRFNVPSSLESLTIKFAPKLNVLFHALSVTPKLRHLSFESTNASPPTSLKSVSLPVLETLEVSVISGGMTETLFRSIIIPATTRLSLTILVTAAGLNRLDNDLHALAAHAKNPLSEHLVSMTASSDGRYFKREAVSICCFTRHRSSEYVEQGLTEPFISIYLRWNHPWPLQREEAFGRIMQALPTEHIDEVALCTTGPPLHWFDQDFYYPHGVRTVMEHLPLVTTVVISSQVLDEIIFSVVSPHLRRLTRIIAIASQWHEMDAQYPRLLGTLFGERRDQGLGEVEIELCEGEDVFVGQIIHRRDSSLYKRGGIEAALE